MVELASKVQDLPQNESYDLLSHGVNPIHIVNFIPNLSHLSIWIKKLNILIHRVSIIFLVDGSWWGLIPGLPRSSINWAWNRLRISDYGWFLVRSNHSHSYSICMDNEHIRHTYVSRPHRWIHARHQWTPLNYGQCCISIADSSGK